MVGEDAAASSSSSSSSSAASGAGADAGAGAGAGAVNVDTSKVDFKQVDSSLAEYSLKRGFGTARVPYRNKHRVLVFSSRGLTMRYRHLLDDLRAMLPHHKKESKLDTKDQLRVVNEIAEVNRCDLCVFFEVRKRRDCFLWVSRTPQGPSARFHLLNLHTMDELRLTGNCLRGSRPLLSFDRNFEAAPHWQLVKELLTQSFGTPRGHPKSQPFYDHVISFALVEGKIWFRHYQVLDTAKDPKEVRAALAAGEQPTSLVEIGPRFVLDLVRIFKGSFGGPTLWQNGDWVSPNKLRHLAALAKAGKYAKRLDAKDGYKARKEELVQPDDGLAGVFAGGEKRGLEAMAAASGGAKEEDEEEEEDEDDEEGEGAGEAAMEDDEDSGSEDEEEDGDDDDEDESD